MLNGACMCGRIQYEITTEPRFMYQCYCSKCRAASGASFVTNIIVDADSFRITAGKESLPPSSQARTSFVISARFAARRSTAKGRRQSKSFQSALARYRGIPVSGPLITPSLHRRHPGLIFTTTSRSSPIGPIQRW